MEPHPLGSYQAHSRNVFLSETSNGRAFVKPLLCVGNLRQFHPLAFSVNLVNHERIEFQMAIVGELQKFGVGKRALRCFVEYPLLAVVPSAHVALPNVDVQSGPLRPIVTFSSAQINKLPCLACLFAVVIVAVTLDHRFQRPQPSR